MPFPLLLKTPDQRHGDNIMSVAINIRPNINPFADDALHRKASAVDQRINIFNMESTTSSGALDGLGCFVHDDATDMETTTRFMRVGVPDIYIYI
jgi:hypothetical protein